MPVITLTAECGFRSGQAHINDIRAIIQGITNGGDQMVRRSSSLRIQYLEDHQVNAFRCIGRYDSRNMGPMSVRVFI